MPIYDIINEVARKADAFIMTCQHANTNNYQVNGLHRLSFHRSK